jgi:hypothetical protein
MTTTGQTSFASKAWDEKSYAEMDGERKLTRTHAVFTYTGDIEGEGTVEYLMAYSPDGLGSFVGLERIVGCLGGRAGSFVVQHTGTFDPKSVTTQWQIVPGSGTGELEGLRGGGQVRLAGHGPYPLSFDYDYATPSKGA